MKYKLIIAGLASALVIFASYRTSTSSNISGVSPSTVPLSFFSDDYPSARAKFRAEVERVKGAHPAAKSWTTALEGWSKDDLTTDFLFVPANGERLLVISSGVHGIEGYTGSAIQTLFLKEQIDAVVSQGIDVLVIHAINANGFFNKSRYTENRVDLNRTWFAEDIFPKNLDDGGYARFASLFNPESSSRFGKLDFNQFILTKITPWARSVASGEMTKAAGIGQYTHPKGIIYGGSDFQPHRLMVLNVLKEHLPKYKSVMGWDLHTGLGKKQLQFLPNPPYNEAIGKLRSQVFHVGERKIEETGGADFYASHGDFSDFLCQIGVKLRADQVCVSMLLEFGTLLPADWDDPQFAQTIRNRIKQAYTLYVNIRENQMYHYGAKTPEDFNEMRKAYVELFYPSAPSWREMVVTDSREILPALIKNWME